MTNDDATLSAAKVLYGRLTLGEFPGGETQKIASIQVFLNELLDAERLTSNPAKVSGYTAQPDAKVAVVNLYKQLEEVLLREIDAAEKLNKENGENTYDPRWLAVARTEFQIGFMALNRAVFQPTRIKLPEDSG